MFRIFWYFKTIRRNAVDKGGTENSEAVAYLGMFFFGRQGSTNSVEDRENGDLRAVAH